MSKKTIVTRTSAGLSKDQRRLLDLYGKIPDAKTRGALTVLAGIPLRKKGGA
jgi:hypothetical protein